MKKVIWSAAFTASLTLIHLAAQGILSFLVQVHKTYENRHGTSTEQEEVHTEFQNDTDHNAMQVTTYKSVKGNVNYSVQLITQFNL